MVTFYCIVVCTFVLMFWLCLYLFEVNNGPKLNEQVTVKRRYFVPGRLVGEAYTPPTWTLLVTSKNGRGTVTVSQTMYEAIGEGDIIRVKGTRGLYSKRWYLREAHREESS